jgi:hypothetical protein
MLSGLLSACCSKDRLIVSHWVDAIERGFHIISELISAAVIDSDRSTIQLYSEEREGAGHR